MPAIEGHSAVNEYTLVDDMSTRRDALRILTGASAALPALAASQETKEKEDQPGHVHTGLPFKVPEPSKPTFFQPGEMATLEAMAERIIPRTDTPGAKDAGVALLIDKAVVAHPIHGPSCRAGLADLNALANASFGRDFAALMPEQQDTLLTPWSLDPATQGGQFFVLIKDLTIEAYYSTEAGLKTELGWHGNTYLTSFPGCDHPEHHT